MDRVPALDDLPFRISFTGHSGHLSLEPLPPVEAPNPLRSLPDFVLPPAFERETRESIKEHIEDKYLTPLLDEEDFSVERSGRQWQFDWFERSKVPLDPSTPTSVLAPLWELPFRRKKNSSGIWDPKTVEFSVAEIIGGALDSSHISHMPGPAKDIVKGSPNNRPFCPGGFDDSQSSKKCIPDGAHDGEWVREVLNGGRAQIVPPSFKQGLDLGCLPGLAYQWDISDGHTSIGQNSSWRKKTSLFMTFEDFLKDSSVERMEKKQDEEGSMKEGLGEIKAEKDHKSDAGGTCSLDYSFIDEVLMDEIDESDAGGTCGVDSSFKDEVLMDEIDESGLCLPYLGGNAIVQKAVVIEEIKDIASNFNTLVPDMALDFPFELDKFQKEAIYYIEKGESVFVAAHTSAGKTVVAEYAFALASKVKNKGTLGESVFVVAHTSAGKAVVAEYAFALASKHCTRAVYTAPIKTISNQKYRDFCGKFDVGLITGDVSLKPEASCLIMTTEILRSMLYKGADIIRDIEWVIFDEVHYVNDVERGVVWEEVIIMLPRHVNIVLLSATVPNTSEFADWICRTKQKKIHVTGTLKRPVPLEHYLFYSGEFYKICQNEVFMPQGLQSAKDVYVKKKVNCVGGNPRETITSASSRGGGQIKKYDKAGKGKQKHSAFSSTSGFVESSGNSQNKWGSWRSDFTSWQLLINKLSKMSHLPVIIFCFSKNRCDKLVDAMLGTDLTSNLEKSKIRIFCRKAFTRLKGSDRNLPQVVRVENLLERGFAVHHAGLLPIVKEAVEMLFCRGFIKVLFSTETFAMGVNAPARTVVFDNLRKFDGKEFRQLLPGEYVQMAGRAGRRGLDKVGTVIVMCRDEIPDEKPLRNVLVGMPTRLESQFRLTYIMILHLLRLEELKVEDMLKRSFAEFHAQKKLPEIELLLSKLSQSAEVVECIKGEPDIQNYFELVSEAEELRSHMSEVIMQSHAAQQFLLPGRVVVVRSISVEDHLLGVVLKSYSAMSKQYIVLVLTTPTTESSTAFSEVERGKIGDFPVGYFVAPKGKRNDEEFYSSLAPRKGSGIVKIKLPHCGSAAGYNYEVIGIEPREIVSICDCKIKIDQVGLLEEPSTAVYSKTVQLLLEKKSAGNKYPLALDPLRDLKLNSVTAVQTYNHYNNLLQKMTDSKCHGCAKLKEHMALMKNQKKHKKEIDALKYQMSDEALQQMPDFQGRIDVLKEIGCIDSDLVVQIKGRVACEMNSGEELICTECLFDNQLEDLEPEEAVALMSALVFQQKNASEPKLPLKLSNARKRLSDTAARLGLLQAQFNVAVNPEEYVQDNLKFGLVEVVYEWAKGTPFAEICELTDVPEGLIVRTIVRLDETCREFKNAALIMGNSALHKKMETASNAIKRDIVFAASLYVTGVE